MKILKEGVKPTAKVKCPKCKAELEVELEDIQVSTEEGLGGIPDTSYSIQCPCCHSNIEASKYYKQLA